MSIACVDWSRVKKYDSGASRPVYDIVTGNESADCMGDSRWAESKKIAACFLFGKTGHVGLILLEQDRTVSNHQKNQENQPPKTTETPYVKDKLRCKRFSTPEETHDAFRTHGLEIPQSEWQ